MIYNLVICINLHAYIFMFLSFLFVFFFFYIVYFLFFFFFFFQAEDGIRDRTVTGVQTCALPILTQVLAFAAWLLFNRNEMRLGGTNGLTDYKTLLGFSLLSPATQRGLYIRSEERRVGKECRSRWWR